MLIERNEFVQIINRLEERDNVVDKVNKIFRNTTDSVMSDSMNAASLMICHEDIVINLLEKIFDDKEIISWWLYEKNYGKNFKMGDFEVDGQQIDLTTAENLYDYLLKEKNERKC